MAYVTRRSDGAVDGVLRWPPSGRAKEELADDHADIAAFRAAQAKPPSDAEAVDGVISNNRVFRALVRVLAAEVGKTPAQVVAAIKAKMR